MLFNLLPLILCLNFMCSGAFFLWKLKKEPFFFCYKVCPLYCSKIKRADLDFAATTFVEDEWADQSGYWEDPGDHHDQPSPHDHHYIYPHDHPHEPHDFEIVKHLKFIYHPKTTTTTTTTTSKPTTTEEPSGICIACMKKCKEWPQEFPWY